MYVKISPSIIQKVKQMAGKESHRAIGQKFGISPTTVFRVVNGFYDSGKMSDRKDVPPEGMFNVDSVKEKTWVI